MVSTSAHYAHFLLTHDRPDKGLFKGDYVFDMGLIPKSEVKLQPGEFVYGRNALRQVGVRDSNGEPKAYASFKPDDGLMPSYNIPLESFLSIDVAQRRERVFQLLQTLRGGQELTGEQLRQAQYQGAIGTKGQALLSIDLKLADAVLIRERWALVVEIKRNFIRLLLGSEGNAADVTQYSLDQLLGTMGEERMAIRRSPVNLISQ